MRIARRSFLAGGAAIAKGRAAAGGIIDTHTHFYDPGRPQGVPWPPKSEPVLYRTVLPPEFLRMTEPLGVAGTIAIEASPWLEDNQWLLDLARREPVIVGVVGNLDPALTEFPAHLERFAANPLFKGIRLNQAKLRSADVIGGLKRLAAAGLQLDVLGGPPMLGSILRVSDAVPGLRIVIDHLPFDPPSDPRERAAFEGALDALRPRKQIYAKVSGVLRKTGGAVVTDPVFYRPALETLWEVFGPDRLIYASNWPVSDRMAPYPQVLAVVRGFFERKGAAAAEKYFHANSLAAYRWKSPV